MQITPQEKHNFAYYQLVSEEDDFIGMVAYTIYKQAKIEYIERYKAEHSVAPDDKALHEFQVQQCGETNIKSHRKHAEELMNAFLTAYLEENEKDLVDREKKNHEKELRLSTKNSEINAKSRELDEKDKTIKKREREVERREKSCPKIRKSFGSGILQSLIASIIFAGLSVLIVLWANIPSDFAQLIASKLK